MFARTLTCLALLASSWFGKTTAIAAEDDLQIRIEAKRESAEAARIKAAEQIKKDADEQIKKIEGRLAEIRKWTKAQFELGERDVIDKPALMTPVLKRWQEQRERQVYQLLQFRDKSAGAIESGRALNLLLERIGPAAYEHGQTRRINPDHGLPLYEPTATRPIDATLLGRLRYEENTLGPKLSGRFNHDPLDVEWPASLREKRWATHRIAVEAARAQVLLELNSAREISEATDSKLREVIAAFHADFINYRQEWVRDLTAGAGNRAFEYHRICDGHRHIERLIGSVYQLVESAKYPGGAQASRFDGGNIEDLLSHMHQNNLRFAPSTGTDRGAYHTVFDMMVRYYLDIKAATNLERRLEDEIGQLKHTSREATNVALGKTMSAADQTALMIEEMKLVRSLVSED